MRLYLPSTLADLARHVAAGEVRGVEGVVADGEDEESEYAALMQAAAESQDLLAGAGRRVVVVAEVDPGHADDPVPLRRVVAVHADPEGRAADADPDEDLAWYAAQEIEQLLAL